MTVFISSELFPALYDISQSAGLAWADAEVFSTCIKIK